jgi:competence ComEA-like helix-hairpin-helix protein
MDRQNNDNRQQTELIKAGFFIGVILCVCFALPGIPNNKKIEFAPVDNKLNPNTASVCELSELPAIGQARAQAIIEYRKTGVFKTADDLENIKGIGEKTASKLKPFLKFND